MISQAFDFYKSRFAVVGSGRRVSTLNVPVLTLLQFLVNYAKTRPDRMLIPSNIALVLIFT